MKSPHPRHGFTLIELLVVVAIIALLVAILAPSLTEANRIAKMVACAANLKVLGLGMHLYCDNSVGNRFPPFIVRPKPYPLQTDPSMPGAHFFTCDGSAAPGDTDHYVCWMDFVFPFVDNTLEVFHCPGEGLGMVQIPAALNEPSYGYNGFLGWYSYPPTNNYPPIRRMMVGRPADKILFIDWSVKFSLHPYDYSKRASNPLPYRHWLMAHGGEQIEVCFIDGHVEPIELTDTDYYTAGYGGPGPALHWLP